MDLRYIRFIKGVTQLDLQLKSGISQGMISRYEMGFARPSPEKHKILCKALEVEETELTWK